MSLLKDHCGSGKTEDLCFWLPHCRWNGTTCTKVMENMCRCDPGPRPWFWWELLLMMVGVNTAFFLVVMFAPWLVQWIFVRGKSVGVSLKNMVLDGFEAIAQWVALYNRRTKMRLTSGYHRLQQREPILPQLFRRPEHVVVELEPLVHHPSPRRVPKEHDE